MKFMGMIKDKIIIAMHEKKITAYRLSQVLDIHESQLSRFFKRGDGLGLKKVEEICKYLGLNLELKKK